jgi:uncharacterized protein (DUF58 family)
MPPNLPQRPETAQRMAVAAEHFRLPFRSRNWRGHAGNWLGVGAGSSIDFQDHRPYLPGDDPRYIDWRAFARTGSYTMKLYREEVSPLVDLVLDVSRSMFFEERKGERAAELFCFCAASARQCGASLHCYFAAGEELKRVEAGDGTYRSYMTYRTYERGGAPDCRRVPWRHGSLRVLVSDLLFAGAPDPILSALSGGQGHGIILGPYSAGEAGPDWNGNIEMTDCETGRKRLQHVDAGLLERYRQAYGRHFGLWRERARKHSVLIARVAAEPDFQAALQAEALPAGAVELA